MTPFELTAKIIQEHQPTSRGCTCGAGFNTDADERWHLVYQAIEATLAEHWNRVDDELKKVSYDTE